MSGTSIVTGSMNPGGAAPAGMPPMKMRATTKVTVTSSK
jgi:hypothetical protein